MADAFTVQGFHSLCGSSAVHMAEESDGFVWVS